MKISNRLNAVLAALLMVGMAGPAGAQPGVGQSAAQRMARYNVVWTSPSKDASGVMPLGNGDLGAGAYAIENGDLYLLLSKSDAFNSTGRLYKTGRVRISLNPNPFTAGKPFRQTLDLPTASVQIEADQVRFRIWVDANRPVYHVEIESPRDLAVTAQPEFWTRMDKTPDTRVDRGDQVLWYFSNGKASSFPAALATLKKSWGVEVSDTLLPDLYRYNTFGNLLESPSLRLADGKLAGRGRKFDLRIHSLTMQTPDPGQEWVNGIRALASKPVDLKGDWDRHCQWWQNFWDRGWVIASDRTLPEDARERFNGEVNPGDPSQPRYMQGTREEKDGAALVAQSYNMFRFYMGALSRARFQAKFNGGLFTQQLRVPQKPKFIPAEQLPDGMWLTHEDNRSWEPYFTSQNQRLLYWPLLMSGDADLMKPFFEHYWHVLEMRKAITRGYFGHEGAFYRENIDPVTGSDGLQPVPKVKPGEPYKGDWLTFHFTSGLEVAAVMIDYVHYTQDTKFRDERLVPFAREILLFFDQHYPRDPNGKLHMEPSQAIETWLYTINPTTDVSGLRFCLDQLLAMKAGTAEDQARWKRFRGEIPEVPTQNINGHQAIVPAESWKKPNCNMETPEIYPLFPFRCYGLALGSKDVAEWTMQNRAFKDTFGCRCWTQDQIGWACAGNAAKAATGLVRRFRAASAALRFPLYGNDVTDGVPDLDHFGSGSLALQRMLAQEGNGKIYLLPAWPGEWDADFKVHLSQGVVITGTVKEGKLTQWDITPKTRKAVVILCEPGSIKAGPERPAR